MGEFNNNDMSFLQRDIVKINHKDHKEGTKDTEILKVINNSLTIHVSMKIVTIRKKY